MANSADTDQTARKEQSGLGLHCFHRHSHIPIFNKVTVNFNYGLSVFVHVLRLL